MLHIHTYTYIITIYFCVEILMFTPKIRQTTLPETNIAMENPPFVWYLPRKMGIFMGKQLVFRRVPFVFFLRSL